MPRRRLILWSAFLGCAATLAAWPDLMLSPTTTPAPPASQPTSRPSTAAPLAALRSAGAIGTIPAAYEAHDVPAPAPAPAPRVDLFAAKTWQPPPPPPPPPPLVATAPTPPQPTAPRMPFSFIGRLDDASAAKVFLQRGERVYVVAVGDVIDGQYRVDRVEASRVGLVFLPLNVTQWLMFGTSS